jgi:hypothetical protein
MCLHFDLRLASHTDFKKGMTSSNKIGPPATQHPNWVCSVRPDPGVSTTGIGELQKRLDRSNSWSNLSHDQKANGEVQRSAGFLLSPDHLSKMPDAAPQHHKRDPEKSEIREFSERRFWPKKFS